MIKIDLSAVIEAAKLAGDAILTVYNQDFTINYKKDNSPLTEADTKANDIISSSLKKLYPNIPILSEEGLSVNYNVRKEWEYFWLIDPLDGTKEFINKNDDFTVNIALIHKNTPILSVVYVPVLQDLYYAKKNYGAFKNNNKLPITSNTKKDRFINVVCSRSHMSQATQDFILALNTKKTLKIPRGSSLKLCLIATGEADIYPRFGPTMEWDTAAAHLLVSESGGKVYDYNTKSELLYNKKSLLNNWFIAES